LVEKEAIEKRNWKIRDRRSNLAIFLFDEQGDLPIVMMPEYPISQWKKQ
jgi:hypothetical protein